MSLSSIDLCSKALNKIGADVIASFDEGSAEAEICYSLYSVLKRKLLSIYPWKFATKIAKLNRVDDNSFDGSFVYALPSDFLRALKIASGCPYHIIENRLYCADDDVVLEYIFDVEEEYFSSVFVSAFIDLLAAELSLSLLNDTSKYSLFYRLFSSDVKEAKSIDSIQETPKSIKNFSLIDARK